MAHIRDDLVGSVYLHTGGPAGPVVLVAGDVVPEGFEVGAHLLADQDTNDEGGVVDESGDTDASDGPDQGSADDGAGTPLPKPSPARRARNRG